MKIIDKKIQYYRPGSARPRMPRIGDPVAGRFVVQYIIEIPEGKITYRLGEGWTCMIKLGTVSMLDIAIPMNEENPEDTINKFESLLVLK